LISYFRQKRDNSNARSELMLKPAFPQQNQQTRKQCWNVFTLAKVRI